MRRPIIASMIAAAMAAGVIALAGCSQIAAVAPVGGSRTAEVRFAAGDVLVREGVEVLVAPVCAEAADTTVTCTGETLDGATIAVTAPGGDPDSVEITVGDETLYAGSIMDVLETAMEPAR